jgi:hypothetical protein
MAETIGSEFSFPVQRQPSAASRFHRTDGTPVVLESDAAEAVKGTNQRLKQTGIVLLHLT